MARVAKALRSVGQPHIEHYRPTKMLGDEIGYIHDATIPESESGRSS